MLKWTENEQDYMLDLIKEHDAASENGFGVIYVRYDNPNIDKIAEELNSVYDNRRTRHSIRKRVQTMKIPSDVFFGRTKKSDESKVKEQILSEIYGVVDYETFIKIQSL